MSLVVDETAGDLPVREVGLRGALLPIMQDSTRDMRTGKRPQVLKIKDRHRVFRIPREQLEDLCTRLQEENNLLRQHSRTQEQKLRRMSTRLIRLREGKPGSAHGRDREMEETIQELETRIVSLESQKETLQNKLSMARQHILEMGSRGSHRQQRGGVLESDTAIRHAAHTAPLNHGLSSLEVTRGDIERLSVVIESQQVRMAELELSAQSLRNTLKEKEGAMKEMRRLQADGHRLTIRENVDVIRLQKQLSEKSAALLVIQEKFNVLQEAYETKLEEGQRSLRESQGALLEKVEELSEQLKEEKLRNLNLEGQLTTITLSMQVMEELKERVLDLEGERNLLKQSYDALLESALSAYQDQHADKESDKDKVKEKRRTLEIQLLEEKLVREKEEKERLKEEHEKLLVERESINEEKEREIERTKTLQEKYQQLEQEVLQHRQEVTSLQDKLDSVIQVFDMSVEELSETLLQIKAFRLQQESCKEMHFLSFDEKAKDEVRELTRLEASHAETVLELQKTRDLLLLQHRLTNDLQAELKTVVEKAERERQESKKKIMEKEHVLNNRTRQIITLQAQHRELAYSPKSYKQTIPVQYTWTERDHDMVQPMEDNTVFSQLSAGESLLEIHLQGASFTPQGLRLMGQTPTAKGNGTKDVVTFCTYALLDFETHATPLVSGFQPNYGFTSHYGLSASDLNILGGKESSMTSELHQVVGGVHFVTFGRAQISLLGVLQSMGHKLNGRANIIGHNGEILGVLDFWVRLYPPAEPSDPMMEEPLQKQSEALDYGGGIPNELEVLLERCVGLSTRWPGLLPDAYLTYRLYDLPPHTSPAVPCSADPVFNDVTIYPLAVTTDLCKYLRAASLWVYIFDESEQETPPTYLAKTPIPLRALSTGRPVRGDYVLRDSAGVPRGMVRVSLRWKYPFQPPDHRSMERESMPESKMAVEQRPIAKPRLKTHSTPTIKARQPTEAKPSQGLQLPAKQKILSTLTQFMREDTASHQQILHKNIMVKSHDYDKNHKSSGNIVQMDSLTQNEEVLRWKEQVEKLEEQGDNKDLESNGFGHEESELIDSDESLASSDSDVIVIPQISKEWRKGDKLRVEILSLSFDPTSQVALDQSVQRVYVEYCLLGVPMETTETPMSLRKPTKGEEIHYNFTRVIYVDCTESGPLRQYLYTILEGTDPHQGRLKFTVVSEPLNDYEECVDVGYAFLDLKELLGNDVMDREIDKAQFLHEKTLIVVWHVGRCIVKAQAHEYFVSDMNGDGEVMGQLKVSLEATTALTGIYREFHQRKGQQEIGKDVTSRPVESEEEKEEEENGEEEEPSVSKQHAVIQVTDYDDLF
ncbi:protein fantom isoform X2 [Denticeps clupeoides]|uniref:protein fantom isoform X2 n=1 Tax=Denticeps clupeoides TaxID=299321 RepID=UPI0010A3005C|nr:protein fantom-like isoform X2 [Denticeps clupeoides]